MTTPDPHAAATHEWSPQQRAQQAVAAAWRMEWPKLVAGLTRRVGDITTAEDLAQDAFAAAIAQWPRAGVPANPGAWLTLTARHRAIDRVRRDQAFARKLAVLGSDLLSADVSDETAITALACTDDAIEDDMLRMIFTACHPQLPAAARASLTLRLVGGLTTAEIARAFLVSEPTIAQRIVRAKRTIADKSLPYEVPHGPELEARLDSVLEVVYLIFNEGHTATTGQNWTRAELCADALRLARMLAALLPAESEAHGLAALLELQSSRLASRTDNGSAIVLLADQDRTRWDQLQVRRGYTALARAHGINREQRREPGKYALQAAIAAVHAMAPSVAQTDWRRIAGLYAQLARRYPSPVVELNRAVAIAELHGPQAALELVDQLTQPLANYHLLHAVRGTLLSRLGRTSQASSAFRRSAELTENQAERELLSRRAQTP